MNKSLTGEEMKKMIPWEINMIIYPQLDDFQNIDDILGPTGCCVLLFENNRSYDTGGETTHSGHWTCLVRSQDDENNSSINFYDSYGFKPDDQKKKIDKDFMNMIDMRDNVLSELLYKACNELDEVIEYNEKRHQVMKKGINTCGRWVCLRILMKDISMNDFQKFVNYLKYKYNRNLDKMISNMTDPVLKNQMTPNDFFKFLSELYGEFKMT